MRIKFKNEHASCALKSTADREVLELVNLWVDPEYRRQGYANGLMKTVGKWADNNDIFVALRAVPTGTDGMSLEQLRDFYIAHDYNPTGRFLIRIPKETDGTKTSSGEST